MSAATVRSPAQARPPWRGGAAVLVLLATSACGGAKEGAATQVAAKVNKEEISVHQVNFQVQRQPNTSPERAEAVRRQVLERLIDQELALQRAEETKLTRSAEVQAAVDAARREVIARAYADAVAATASKPAEAEIKAYYDAHPALFKDRRIYRFQETLIDVPADEADTLAKRLQGAKGIDAVNALVKSAGYPNAANQAVRAAEQLPLSEIENLALMKDGDVVIARVPTGLRVLALSGSKTEPVDEAKAAPAIEQFLLNERRRALVEADRKNLRGRAAIEYVGDYKREPANGTAPASGASKP